MVVSQVRLPLSSYHLPPFTSLPDTWEVKTVEKANTDEAGITA